jgi:dTDP-4-amino-4,6-dideoxygalactose transaminase
VQHQRREQLARHLASRGIQTAVNYPVALPFLPAYRRLAYTPASFPVAYRHQSRILSLPIFPEMTAEQHSAVVAGVRAFGADPA